MFHPSIRNFLRSNSRLWKKQSVKSSFLYLSAALQRGNCCSFNIWYSRFIFAFKPYGDGITNWATEERVGATNPHTLGGSVVILIPACSMEIGKSGFGLLLNQSRKSLCGSLIYKEWHKTHINIKSLYFLVTTTSPTMTPFSIHPIGLDHKLIHINSRTLRFMNHPSYTN